MMASARNSVDEPLLSKSTVDNFQHAKHGVEGRRLNHRPRPLHWVLGLLAVSQALSFALVIALALKLRATNAGGPFPQLLYSPVQHLLAYQEQVFHEGIASDRTIYQQPPSPKVDQAWDDLYQFGLSNITKSEATHIPGDEDHFVIELDVFHQLHCLNMLRKALHPEYYTEKDHLDPIHWDHCIESLRQSLLCSVDVTPIVWQWIERVQQVRIVGNVAHTCRDFEVVKKWALERRVMSDLDFAGFVGP